MIALFGALFVVLYKPRRYDYFIINLISLLGYIFVVSYATEFIQGFTPSRSNSFKDVMINFLGAVCAFVLVVGVFFLIKGIVKSIKKNKMCKLDEEKQ